MFLFYSRSLRFSRTFIVYGFIEDVRLLHFHRSDIKIIRVYLRSSVDEKTSAVFAP